MMYLLLFLLQVVNSYISPSSFKKSTSFQLSYIGNEGLNEDQLLDKAILLKGPVMEGYGRGSKQLGVPTANLPQFDSQLKKYDIKRGVYFGWARVDGDERDYPVVCNIGFSPTFEEDPNDCLTIEAHLLDRVKLANEEEQEVSSNTIEI